MRVALVSTSFPSCRDDYAGYFVRAEALALARTGVEVHVLSPGEPKSKDRWIRENEEDGVCLHVLGGGGLFGAPGVLSRVRQNPFRLVRLPSFLACARRTLCALEAERVIAHFVVPCGYPLAVAAPGDIEIVGHGSDVHAWTRLPSPFRRYTAERWRDRGIRLRFSSHAAMTELVGALPSALSTALAARSRVEPPPLALGAFDKKGTSDLSSLALPPLPHDLCGLSYWVSVGRLIQGKRVDRCIRYAKAHGHPLVVLGDGPEQGALRALAHRLGAQVIFLGAVPRPMSLRIIGAAQALVHFSEREGAPSAVREARALGVPVRASPSGDIARWAADDPGIEIVAENDTANSA